MLRVVNFNPPPTGSNSELRQIDDFFKFRRFENLSKTYPSFDILPLIISYPHFFSHLSSFKLVHCDNIYIDKHEDIWHQRIEIHLWTEHECVSMIKDRSFAIFPRLLLV